MIKNILTLMLSFRPRLSFPRRRESSRSKCQQKSKEVFLFYLVLISFLSSCSDLKESGIIDGDACFLCHAVPPDEAGEHNFSYEGTYNFECKVCHESYSEVNLSVNSKLHYNGRKDVVFDTAYFQEIFQNYKVPAYRRRTCSNIPCHGYGIEGKYNTTWNEDSTFITWNDTASFTIWNTTASIGDTLGCNGGHNTTEHKKGKNCDNCHEIVTKDGVNITNYSLHVNGILEKDKRN